MTNKTPVATVLLFVCFTAMGLTPGFTRGTSSVAPVEAANVVLPPAVIASQECAKCEGKCKAWIDKCKDGGQYACYKAAACLCKCNLDAGGCGSSKKALEECVEQNEKAAKELGPPDPEE
ncbi:MAG TPA: hypothetical protein VN844_21815 [Pyrinomonadaceae bacterium]|nr:hypothetical protein [Pyrinomonadaceae bacterium]